MNELKVLSTHAAMSVIDILGPAFERAHTCRLTLRYDPAKAIRRHIDDGTAFDVAIVTREVFDDLVAQRKMLAEPRADIGRSGLGLSVRKGAAKPDIGTADAFKRALLAAKSIVRSVEGSSGIYFERLLDRLGIAESMRDKIVLGPSGRVAELAARGEVDMAVQQVSELLPVKGADYVGPFPPEFQLYTEFTAGVASASTERALAAAFVGALARPDAAALFKTAGLEPVR